jgi:hypothetical protein
MGNAPRRAKESVAMESDSGYGVAEAPAQSSAGTLLQSRMDFSASTPLLGAPIPRHTAGCHRQHSPTNRLEVAGSIPSGLHRDYRRAA